MQLSITQLEILEIAQTAYHVVATAKMGRHQHTNADLVAVIKHIYAALDSETPAYVKPAKDGIHCHVLNGAGRYLVFNKPVLAEYAALNLPVPSNDRMANSERLYKAIDFLRTRLAVENGLPRFKNGNFYAETRRAIAQMIHA